MLSSDVDGHAERPPNGINSLEERAFKNKYEYECHQHLRAATHASAALCSPFATLRISPPTMLSPVPSLRQYQVDTIAMLSQRMDVNMRGLLLSDALTQEHGAHISSTDAHWHQNTTHTRGPHNRHRGGVTCCCCCWCHATAWKVCVFVQR